ncbi:hypothetical protein ADIWIN_1808 [Winogradskyella psychrotolerans RS-3]|uniref:Bacteriocin n=1 Tax=Winogradskyella psychrotolerans RS-3 TaxID=641526 RepID=S7VUH6_9FLAO|nr:hypothetical protein ADIWIN_1808 [Winogradskyella psychrotolerans RS-3]
MKKEQLSRGEMRSINGGGGAGSVCKVTCNNGDLEGVSGCSSTGASCRQEGQMGVNCCSCDYPNPLDPPTKEFTP